MFCAVAAVSIAACVSTWSCPIIVTKYFSPMLVQPLHSNVCPYIGLRAFFIQ